MDERSQVNTMLQLLPQAAFFVEDGVISQVNQAAGAYCLQSGQDFLALLQCGREEYAEFTGGALYVTLLLAEQSIGACVTRMDGKDLVTLEQQAEMPQLQAMALAAEQLREPLSGMLSLAEQMLPAWSSEGSQQQNQAAQMNRRLYQMLRIITNMSDAVNYAQAQRGQMETVEICAFLEEILEKAAAMAQAVGISLSCTLPKEPIFTLADTEKLERAVYNLLSNAMKFADPNTTVQVKAARKDKRLSISVSNCHSGTAPLGNVYARFLREPALEDRRNGIGLGMVLSRSVAAIHGGALLVDQTGEGTRVTMTIQLKSNPSNQLSSPIRRFDYAGEWDHCLLELSDVLPAQLYGSDYID